MFPCSLKVNCNVPLFPESKWPCSLVPQNPFQASLDQGIIPDEWKSANVVPIYKKGDRSKPENYRSVSLTSITCKTLEHEVSSSIMKHLDSHSILTDAQHGFRKRISCETQVLLPSRILPAPLKTWVRLMSSYWTFPKPSIKSHTYDYFRRSATMGYKTTLTAGSAVFWRASANKST